MNAFNSTSGTCQRDFDGRHASCDGVVNPFAMAIAQIENKCDCSTKPEFHNGIVSRVLPVFCPVCDIRLGRVRGRVRNRRWRQ